MPPQQERPPTALEDARQQVPLGDRRRMFATLMNANINDHRSFNAMCVSLIAEAAAANLHPDTMSGITKLMEMLLTSITAQAALSQNEQKSLADLLSDSNRKARSMKTRPQITVDGDTGEAELEVLGPDGQLVRLSSADTSVK